MGAAEKGERLFYSQVMKWFNNNGLNIENFHPFDTIHLYKMIEQNKVFGHNLWQFITQKTWITLSEPLPKKMADYKDHLMNF